ncbi:MAG: phosphate/phosphite/phosphonate ABC transporter substrate-binding protein [Nitrospira sp.]|nr:phosphate/phosphite/phosphonate ABC transporter substrate-binding protein [Nitrospira sp.]
MYARHMLSADPDYSRRILCIVFAVVLSITAGCSPDEKPKKVSLYAKSEAGAHRLHSPKPNTLWFGFDLRLGPKEEISIYSPFLKYLESSTGNRFRIKFTKDYEDTVGNLGNGSTHFAALGTLSYVIGEKKYGIKYLVSGVNREGDARYHAMIVVPPDSDIQTIADIAGRCFAFGSNMSTQGHLIPRKMLEDGGVTLDRLKKYFYAGSHSNAVKAILNRECDAAGLQDTLANRLAAEGKLRIIKISEPYPSSVIAYNNSIDAAIVQTVRKALLEFEPQGRNKDQMYDWDRTEMPLGFTGISELELQKVRVLAERYDLLQ